MFFTKAGKIVAYLGFAAGVIAVLYGSLVIYGFIDTSLENPMVTSSHLKNQGYNYIAASIALGILSEISAKLHARPASEDRSDS